MSETLEYVNYLSREIGPRPAGTEEERQAAEFIADTIESGSGLPVEIEDFSAAAGYEAPHVICMGVAVVAGLFSLFSPIFGIPALILLVIVTALLVAEYLDKPLIARLLSRGASQNVVAKYQPGIIFDEGRGRKRKIVVVARYDSGKVRNELTGGVIKALPIVQRVSFWSVPAMLVLVFIRSVILGGDTGAAGSFFAFLVILTIICSLVPLVLALLHRISPYNEAANSNASGVAAMMEIAGRIGRGRMTEEEIEHLGQYQSQDDELSSEGFSPEVHGAQEAVAAGVVPEGADLYYEAEPTVEFVNEPVAEQAQPSSQPVIDESTPGGRLLAAKAAIAAMTGAAVSNEVYSDLPVEPEEEVAPIIEDVTPSAQAAVAVAATAEAAVPAAENFAYLTAQRGVPAVPDWFTAAQERAKANKPSRPANDNVKRSRYAEALDAAMSASAVHFDAANEEALTGMDAQIEQLNDGIVEVKAPGFETVDQAEVPAVGHADNDILAGVVTGFEGMVDAPSVSMPSFLENERFEGAVEPATRQENRVMVTAYAEEAPAVDVVPSSSADAAVEAEPVEPVSDFVGQITSGFTAVSAEDDPNSLSKRLPKVLPSATDSFAAVGEGQKQRAPLADSTSTAKSLLSMLPSIEPNNPTGEGAKAADSVNLAATVPSLSGTMPAVNSSAAPNTGSAGATGVFAPVTDELVKSASEDEDLYIEDADDSEYQENFTESGAFAGPDYVEMPKAPIRNFFDRIFHRKKKEQTYAYDDEPYYDDEPWPEDGDRADDFVDEPPYDGDDDYVYDDQYDEKQAQYDDEYVRNGARYNGGALSALKDAASSVGDKASHAAQGVAGRVKSSRGNAEASQEAEPAATPRRGRFSAMVDDVDFGYESSPRARFEEEQRMAQAGEVAADGGFVAQPAPDAVPGDVPGEFDQVESFRNPYVNAEVWFVALGSELAGNAGMRAFLDAHAPELRGAIIVELDSLGGGKLSLVETEGSLKKVSTSSRMKRYMRKVAQATGVTCAPAHFGWNDSASSYANGHGFSAMHLVGVEGNKPALFAQDDDVVENVDEQILDTNVECVMELLHTI